MGGGRIPLTFPWNEPRLSIGTYKRWFLTRPLQVERAKARLHWRALGVSGSGKSYFLANLFLQLHAQGYSVLLLDPHGDLGSMLLARLAGAGWFTRPDAYEHLLYLDLPAAERQERYPAFNFLAMPGREDVLVANIKDAFHRAWPELGQGAAIFDTLLGDLVQLLVHNQLPITSMLRILTDRGLQKELLAKEQDQDLIDSLRAYTTLDDMEQVQYSGSLRRRARQLTQVRMLNYSLRQRDLVFDFRSIMEQGKSAIINLALPNRDAQLLLGSFLTVMIEHAAKSFADTPEQLRKHTCFVILDEFPFFTTRDEKAFTAMLSEVRKYNVYLVLAHQTLDQLSPRLQSALQNVGHEVTFGVGALDASWMTRVLARFDPASIKHEPVREGGMPLYDPLLEQQATFAQSLADLPARAFLLKERGKPATQAKTIELPPVAVDAELLASINQTYLDRYFTPLSELQVTPAPTRIAPPRSV